MRRWMSRLGAWRLFGRALGLGLIVLLLAACGGERKEAQSGSADARSAQPAVSAQPPAASPAMEVPGAAQTAPAEPVPSAAPSSESDARPDASGAARTAPGEGEAEAEVDPALPALPPVAERPAAPEISVTDMSGRRLTLADYRGKVLLAVFWATWCRPCMMEVPHLVHLQEAYGGRGFGILGLSLDRRGMAVVQPFLQAHPEINYTIVPNGMAAADAFGGITSIPTSVLIDRSGRVIRGFVGLVPGEMLEGYVKAALAEPS